MGFEICELRDGAAPASKEPEHIFMIKSVAWLLLIGCWGISAAAQAESPRASDAGAQSDHVSPPPVAKDPQDDVAPVPAAQETEEVDATASDAPQDEPPSSQAQPHAADDGSAQQPALLPSGTNAAAPLGATLQPRPSLEGHFAGFAQADFALQLQNEKRDRYHSSFRPREAELDMFAGYGDVGAARVDLNVIADQLSASSLSAASLVDSLVEQAWAEWTPSRYTLRLGRMDAPFGLEKLDAPERTMLTRAAVSRLASPDLLTAVVGGVEVTDAVDVQLLVANGWDRAIDNNRSKSLGLVVPHRLGPYEGNLGFLAGVERRFVNDWRFLVDYSGELQLAPMWSVAGELLWGAEQGLELLPRQGLIDPNGLATWYGGILEARFDGGSRFSFGKLRAAARIEYLHDGSLLLNIGPTPLGQRLSTLVGAGVAARYTLVRGLEVGLEYRSDFSRRDLPGMSLRNFDAFPGFWNLGKWFVTQEARVAFVALF